MDTNRQVELEHRRKTALNLRLEGLNYRDIATEMGMSVSTVHGYAHDSLSAITREEATALRELEVRRLDQLQAAVWDKALEGDLRAVDSVLKIIDRRARLLGLDAPQQVAINSRDVDLDGTVDKIMSVAMLVAEREPHDALDDEEEQAPAR